MVGRRELPLERIRSTMATSSWTPGSNVHYNDGVFEQDLSFVNNDNFSSVYRLYGTGDYPYTAEMKFRHAEEAPTVLLPKMHRHTFAYSRLQPSSTGGKDSLFAISLSVRAHAGMNPADLAQATNGVAALFSVLDVRQKLLAWRI